MPDTTSSAFDGEQMPSITRVVIENYKSIAHCDVRLGPLIFLVGRNASGKSNFLDALHFLADSLRQSVAEAIRIRGNIGNISRLDWTEFQALGVRVEFLLTDGRAGYHAFQIKYRKLGDPWVLHREECRIWASHNRATIASFRVLDGVVTASEAGMPAAQPNELYLAVASSVAAFHSVYKTLSGMHFYDLKPAAMRHSMSESEALALDEDGSNISGLLLRLARQQPEALVRINEYLRSIVPEIQEVGTFWFGGQFPLTIQQRHSEHYRFGSDQLSEGTLRALGILLALFQQVPGEDRMLSLIGIEEPETGLHPAALAAMRDAFADASDTTQLVITTHSTDLLDDKNVNADWIRVVIAENGATRIGPLSEASRSIVRDHLSTAGELLRSSPLEPSKDGDTYPPRALFDD